MATGLGNNDDDFDTSMLLDNYHPSESSGTEADLYGLEKDNSDDEGAEDAGSDSRKATPGDDNSSDAEV